MTTKKVVAWSAGVISILLIIGYAFVEYTFSGWGLCANEMFETSLSPSGTHQVVVFQRDCGATTGFSTQVSILNAGTSLPDDAGNVYIGSGHPQNSNLVISWQTDRNMSIGNADSTAFKKESVFGPIEIVYE